VAIVPRTSAKDCLGDHSGRGEQELSRGLLLEQVQQATTNLGHKKYVAELAARLGLGNLDAGAPSQSMHVAQLRRGWRDLTRNPLGAAQFRDPQVAGRLEVQPGTRVTPEIARQTHGRIGGNAAPLPDDIVDAWCGYAECPRQGQKLQCPSGVQLH
jgi:hypothetical protein